ncbi:deoxyribonuclease IV [Anaeromyxobacter diazotrophicus]|uniref:Probable endonuclease 4 n=1 Tax=Anaeromyxobacter diazotrophicus TaxID=2590199 RepID=A0A7I9VRP0_9BACT|nr:deoxyribonuclease IV [Anaeromyxobacter diazotrophicus]GEJ58760.1 putative endonuclease 4 [Anaeromyxobacter diazotrophicus]
MILGAHEGVAGGVSTAFARAEADGAECLQIFTRNVRGWAAKPLEPDEVARFRAESRRTGFPVAAHSTYLVNLCCADADIRRKSWDALADELARCEQLGIRWLVFHPGSHADEAEGIRTVAEGMASALERSPGKARLLVETTAGQGSNLGWRFEQVAAIRAAVPAALRRRVGVCVDTCHLHAAGYDLATPEGYEATLAELDRTIGLARVEAFHLNDCKKPRGCRVDRHEHIGQGTLGLEAFRRLVNDRRFAEVPAFLETELRFKENLAVLRSLLR